MHAPPIRRRPPLLPLLLGAVLAAPVVAAGPGPGGINDQIRADMADARREMRADLALARVRLDAGNLELGVHLPLARQQKADRGQGSPPHAAITPDGELLIDARPVALDARQRHQLQSYREQVIDIARLGIDVGELAAEAALDTVDQGLFGLLFSAMTGRLERRIERTVLRVVEPGVLRICERLPALFAAQQHLAESVPEFSPYATLQAGEVEDCAHRLRRELTRTPGRTPPSGATLS